MYIALRVSSAFIFFFTTARESLVGQGLHIVENTQLHSYTPHSVGLLWKIDRPDAETSTWQHTTLTTDRQPCSRLDSNPQSQQAKGHRPKPWTARPPGSATMSFVSTNFSSRSDNISRITLFIGYTAVTVGRLGEGGIFINSVHIDPGPSHTLRIWVRSSAECTADISEFDGMYGRYIRVRRNVL